MANRFQIAKNIDWITIGIYFVFVILGWLNIYAADYNPDQASNILSPSIKSGKQFIWMVISVIVIVIFYIIDYKIFETIGYFLYGLIIVLLVAVLFFGTIKNGARSWFDLGFISLQPSEFAKIATCLALSKFLSTTNPKNLQNKYLIFGSGIFLLPAVLILLQPDTGSTLVFFSLVLVLYINGIKNPLFFSAIGLFLVFILALGIPRLYLLSSIVGLAALIVYFFRKKKRIVLGTLLITAIVIVEVLGTQFFVNNVLRPHQKKRIEVILDPASDPRGAGWNTLQSKIAIGSGGTFGKGFLNGNITKGDFVPEQFTDFIFCTIGEEHGFAGSFVIVALFVALLLRLVKIAERQKSHFAHLYAYSVASILFFHFFVNVGMAIGILPVVGIPLPFFSYGGSSLLSFTILLFILLKLDMHRSEMLARR